MPRLLFPSIFTVVALIAAPLATAQGTVSVSNLNQTPTGSAEFGSDYWLAQSFITGTNVVGYALDSVQVLMAGISGDPNGFVLSLCSKSDDGAPGTSVGSLTGVEPSGSGLFTYTASEITLLPSTLYFVVGTAATPVAQGAYQWSYAEGPSGRTEDGWIIPGQRYRSTDGSTWTYSRQYTLQLAVHATAVPEPTASPLLGLGLLAMLLSRRRS